MSICEQQVVTHYNYPVHNLQGTPEDLIFFYDHLRRGGRLVKVEEPLLLYRYHPAATTFSVSE